MKFSDLTNTRKTVKDGVDTTEFEFKPLKEFIGKEVNPIGFFFSNGNYGKQVTVVTDDCLINMPMWSTSIFEKISKDENAVKDFINGKCAIVDIKEKPTRKGNPTVVFKFEDR